MVARWGLGLRMWIKLIAHERWQGAGEIWKSGWMHPLSTESWQQAWIQGRSQEIKVSQIQGAIPNQHRARVWTWGLMRGMGCKSGWWLCFLDIHFCTWRVRKIPCLAPPPLPFFLSFLLGGRLLYTAVSFCCTTKWIGHMDTWIPSFLDFLPV